MEALPDWRKKQLFKLADKLEELTQHWEDSYFEAAQELRVFAEGRAMVPSEDGSSKLQQQKEQHPFLFLMLSSCDVEVTSFKHL